MRVSSDQTDSGYLQFIVAREHGKIVRVFLDGEEVRKCDIADDEEGFVRRCVLDAEGRIQIDPTDPEMIWTEIAKGDVRIEFTDG